MNTVRRFAVVMAVACAAATLSAGPASAAKQVTVAKWVHGICTNLVDWRDELEQKSQDFQDTVSSSDTITDVKDKLVQFLDDVVASTQSMIVDAKALGTPNMKNGAAIAGLVRAGLAEMQSGFRQALTDAQSLPTDDPTSFQTEATAITKKLDSAANRAGKIFDSADKKYDTSAISKALKKDPACKGLA